MSNKEETTFRWDDGFWVQETGENMVEHIDSYLCKELNGMRFRTLKTPGFGVKNRDGEIIYESGIVFKKRRFYYDIHETMMGDGHYPFVKCDANYPDFIDYWFVLDNSGYWVQQGDVNIQGIDGTQGQCDALNALNDGPVNGIGIKNLYVTVVCPK